MPESSDDDQHYYFRETPELSIEPELPSIPVWNYAPDTYFEENYEN